MSRDEDIRYVQAAEGMLFSDPDWIREVNRNQPLFTEAQAWMYFVHLGQVDNESDNWNLVTQFSHDPTFTYDRLKQALRSMQGGKQYRFSEEHSQPPQYWVLQEIDQRSMAILETWAFVGVQVFKCNTIFDLIQTRLLNVTEHISASMHQLESSAPLPSIRELKFWQSAPVQLPGQEETIQLSSVPDVIEATQEGGEAPGETTRNPEKTKKNQTKRPPDMALLWALQTMQQALPEIVGDGATKNMTVKSKEADMADRLTTLNTVPTSGKPRGAKRGLEAAGRDPAKQARFAA